MGNRRTTRTVRPAVEYPVIRVLVTNTVTGETARVPQLYTLADIQSCVDHAELSGTADVRCTACGESVADCIELAPLLVGVPLAWSWTSKVGDDF